MAKDNKQPKPLPETVKKVRVDKWLWAVRIFKTRTLATDACKAGKVKINGNTLKASFEVRIGEELQVKKESFNLTFKVLDILEKRVSAPLAQAACENLTSAAEMEKFRTWFVEIRDRGTGRPTKRDRRDIDDYKDGDTVITPVMTTEVPNDFSWMDDSDDDE